MLFEPCAESQPSSMRRCTCERSRTSIRPGISVAVDPPESGAEIDCLNGGHVPAVKSYAGAISRVSRIPSGMSADVCRKLLQYGSEGERCTHGALSSASDSTGSRPSPGRANVLLQWERSMREIQMPLIPSLSVVNTVGVYVDGACSTARFRWVKAPTDDELTQLTHTIAHRIA